MQYQLQKFPQAFDYVHCIYCSYKSISMCIFFLFIARHIEILSCNNNLSFSQNSNFVQQFLCSNENIS